MVRALAVEEVETNREAIGGLFPGILESLQLRNLGRLPQTGGTQTLPSATPLGDAHVRRLSGNECVPALRQRLCRSPQSFLARFCLRIHRAFRAVGFSRRFEAWEDRYQLAHHQPVC